MIGFGTAAHIVSGDLFFQITYLGFIAHYFLFEIFIKSNQFLSYL